MFLYLIGGCRAWLLLFVCCYCISCVTSTALNQYAWVAAGLNASVVASASSGTTGSVPTSMAFDPLTSIPYVAFIESNFVSVKRLSNRTSTWQYVGIQRFSGRSATSVSIAIDPLTGQPWVAYIANTGTTYPVIQKYVPSTGLWMDVGDLSATVTNPAYLSIRFGSDKSAQIAFCQSQANVLQYDADAGTWNLLGNSNFASVVYDSNYVSGLAMAVDEPRNMSYVVFRDAASSYKATVMRYSPSASQWSIVGAAGISAAGAGDVSIAVDLLGNVYIAYVDGNTGSRCTVQKYSLSSNSWSTVGSAGFSAGSIAYTTLVISRHSSSSYLLYVAFISVTASNTVAVYRYNTSAFTTNWLSVGPSGSISAVVAGFPTIGLDNVSTPFLAFSSAADGSPYAFRGTCNSGYAGSMFESCLACIPGTFSSTVDLVDCQQCPLGSATNVTASLSCSNCSTGYFSNTTGAQECDPCPAGSFSAASSGSRSCTLCSQGTWSLVVAATNASACVSCPSGTYGSRPGLSNVSQCSACPPGTFSNSSGSTNCFPCSKGTYSSAGSTNCSICSAGFYSSSDGGSCMACPAGRYSTEVGATTNDTCLPCPQGFFSNSSGMSFCFPCTAGSYGRYRPEGSNSSYFCELCPAGTFSSTIGSNTSQTCLQCPKGTYSQTKGATSDSVCLDCASGSFANVSGSTECLTCPSGTFSNTSRSVSCAPCPRGTWSNVTGSNSLSNCTGCPAGSYSEAVGATDPLSACLLCPAGTNSSLVGAGLKSSCVACPFGTFSGLPGAKYCNDCPRGTFANGTGMTFCLNCSAGYFADLSGSANCRPCGSGSYSLSGASQCIACPLGYYAPAEASRTCFACASGEFGSDIGIASCQPCPAGTYSIIDAAVRCFDCPVGYYAASERSKECTPCTTRNTYGATTASSASSSESYCGSVPGFYWSGNGNVRQCTPTSACKGGGFFGNFASQCASGYTGEDCSNCALGYYRATDGTCDICSFPAFAFVLAVTALVIFPICCLISPGFRTFVMASLTALRPLIFMFQLLHIVAGVGGASSSSSVRALFSIGSLLMLDFSAFRSDCAVQMSSIAKVILSFSVICFVFGCFVVALLIVTFGIPLFRKLRYKGREVTRRQVAWARFEQRELVLRIIANFVSVFSVLFLPLVAIALTPYDCSSTLSGTAVLDADPSVICYDFSAGSVWSRLFGVSVVALLLSCGCWFGIAFAILSLHIRSRRGQSSGLFVILFGGALQDVQQSSVLHLLWDFFVIKLRDATLVSLSVFFTSNPLVQLSGMTTLLFLTMFIMFHFRPYRLASTQIVTTISYVVVVLVSTLALFNMEIAIGEDIHDFRLSSFNNSALPNWVWDMCVALCVCTIMVILVVCISNIPFHFKHSLERPFAKVFAIRTLKSSTCSLQLENHTDARDRETDDELSQMLSWLPSRLENIVNFFLYRWLTRVIDHYHVRVYGRSLADSLAPVHVVYKKLASASFADHAHQTLASCNTSAHPHLLGVFAQLEHQWMAMLRLLGDCELILNTMQVSSAKSVSDALDTWVSVARSEQELQHRRRYLLMFFATRSGTVGGERSESRSVSLLGAAGDFLQSRAPRSFLEFPLEVTYQLLSGLKMRNLMHVENVDSFSRLFGLSLDFANVSVVVLHTPDSHNGPSDCDVSNQEADVAFNNCS